MTHSNPSPLEILRHTFHQPPTEDTWEQAWTILTRAPWSSPDELQTAFEYTHQHIQNSNIPPDLLRTDDVPLPNTHPLAPLFSLITTLDFYQRPLSLDDVQRIASSKHLRNLHTLDLSFSKAPSNTLHILSNTHRDWAPNLRNLYAANLTISPDSLSSFATSTLLQNLHSLDFEESVFENHTLHTFPSIAQAPSLQTLSLASTRLNDDGGRSFFSCLTAQSFPSLNTLSLRFNSISTHTLSALLSNAQHLPSLQHLHLRGCKIDDEALALLLDDPFCTQLHTLDLAYNPLSPEGVGLLSDTQHLTSLQNLTLTLLPTHRRAIEALQNHPSLPSLKRITTTPPPKSIGMNPPPT